MSITTPSSISTPDLTKKKSTPTLRKQPSNNLIRSKKNSIFKRLAFEWNSLLSKIRSVSDEVFLSDEIVNEYFENQLSDDSFDRIIRLNKGYKSPEENFMEKYRKYKSLDKMTEIDTVDSTKKSISLQDLLSNDENNDLQFLDLNVEKLRQEFEQTNSCESSSNNTIQSNIGTTLWEYRRNKWLMNNDPKKVKQRVIETSIDHLPKDAYIKIYNNLVEKGKPLKKDKRLNLKDVVKVINVGWIVEEKWDRAAKGLP